MRVIKIFAIDVTQNIKQSAPFVINYPLLIPMHSLKVNTLGCTFIDISPRVKYVWFSITTDIIYHRN